MKQLISGLLLLILLGVAYAAWGGRGDGIARRTPAPTPTSQPTANDVVTIEAAVKPRASVALHFSNSDTVAEVLVKEGDHVAAGAVLARLDTQKLALQVNRARAALEQAEARYKKLKDGATPEELAAAEAAVAQAQGQLQQATGSVSAQDTAAAQKELTSARAALARLEAGPKTSEVRAAQAVLEQARTSLALVEAGPKPAEVQARLARLDQAKAALASLEAGPQPVEVQAAQAALDQAKANYDAQSGLLSAQKTRSHEQMEQAADDVRLAQSAYSNAYADDEQARAGRDPRTGQPFSDLGLDEETAQRSYAAALAEAEARLRQAESKLEEAKVSYELARQAEISGLEQAQAQIMEAQAHYDSVLTSIDPEMLAAARADLAEAQASYDKLVTIDPAQRATARAQVASAQATLDQLLQADPSALAAARARVAQAQANLSKLQGDEQAGRVAAAQAGVVSTQANLDELKAGALPSDLAGALADVTTAKVGVEEAELALHQAALAAPIGGTVAQVTLKVGELPSGTEPAIVLADLSVWQIETIDLTELEVIHIEEGAKVLISVDALPDLRISGTVARINLIGANRQGDITYTAIITPDTFDPRLRWNMTASIQIPVKR